MHIDNKGKDILICGEWPTQGIDDTRLTEEAKYSVNFMQSSRRFVLSLHYNGGDSFLFDNSTKIYWFKAKDLEIKTHPLCLGNISKDFTINNLKKTGFKGSVKFFSVDNRSIYTNEIFNMHRYLMKELL